MPLSEEYAQVRAYRDRGASDSSKTSEMRGMHAHGPRLKQEVSSVRRGALGRGIEQRLRKRASEMPSMSRVKIVGQGVRISKLGHTRTREAHVGREK